MSARKLRVGETITSHGIITTPKYYKAEYSSTQDYNKTIVKNRTIVFSILGALFIIFCALAASFESVLALVR